MGCSQSKAPATPAARTARVESARESLDGRSWAAHASYELPPEDRRAGPPPSRPSAVGVCEHFRDAPTPTPAFGLGLPARDTPPGETSRLEFEDRGVVHADRAAALWRCPALLDAPPGSRVCSPWFTLPAPPPSPSSSPILPDDTRPSERARFRPSRSSSRLEFHALDWRLFWETQDFSPESCSLYLECRRDRDYRDRDYRDRDRDRDYRDRDRDQPWAVNVCFSFAVVRGDVEGCERPTRARRVDPDVDVRARFDANRERPKKKADASDDDADDPPVAGPWYASIRDTLGFGRGAARRADVENVAAEDLNLRAHRIPFATCSCGDESCDVARRLRRAGRGMEMAMAHTFAGGFDEAHEARGRSRSSSQTQTQPRTQWGAREYLTYEDIRFASSDSRRTDLLVEVTFHSIGDVEDEEEASEEASDGVSRSSKEASDGVSRSVGADRRGSRRDSNPGTESSAGDGDARKHRLRPAPPAWPAAHAPSLCHLAASPLGAPEASVQLLSESPLLLVFDNFLAAEECAELMSIAEPDLRRSRVTDGKLSDGRTSSSTFLTGAKQDEPIVRTVERRVLRAVKSAGRIAARRAEERGRAGGHACALSGAEPMQVVKYDEGQMYTAHYDNKQGCVRRAATFMMYLSDVDAGGATHFPKATPTTVRDFAGASADAGARRGGVRIWPKRGRAVCFWSVRAGVEDPRSLHEAEPIVAGEKWIATKWLQVEEEEEEDEGGDTAAEDARDAETR